MFGNLSIRSKLLALLAVPVTAAVLLCVAGVTTTWGDRAHAGKEHRAAAAAGRVVAAVHELQEERVRAAAFLAGDGRDGLAGLRDRRRRVDAALADYRAAATGLVPTGDPALDQAMAVATERLDRLAVVRVEVDRRVDTPERAMAGHDAMVDALLGVTRGLATSLQAPAPALSARLLLAIAAAKEATSQERVVLASAGDARAAGGAGAARAPANPAEAAAPDPAVDARHRLRLTATAAVARQELNGVRAVAGGHLEEIDRALGVPGVRDVRGLELALLDPGAGRAGAGDLELWRGGLTARAAALRRLERAVVGELAGASTARLARREAGLRDRLVLLAVTVLASLAALLLLWRGPLGRGAAGQDRSIVPGLARRGQALAARQLQLLGELAAEEPDRHRRRGLRGVDHLANRLRRTAETLIAVSGTEPAGRWTRPVPLNKLLHAAVAEADPGSSADGEAPVGAVRRVDLLTAGEVEVEGPAGTDLLHLLAELLDNAAAFSPPGAPISVTGGADGDDYLIEVSDRGLGMTDQELTWANQRLAGAAAGEEAGEAASDRLGLVVAGRLAARSGLGVRLGRSPGGGVTAAVRVPAGLLSTRSPAPAHPG